MKKNIKVLGFDADDTLWINETFFRSNEDKFAEMMLEFQPNKEECIQTFYKVVIKNMHLYGYGIKAFMLSMIETAMQISNNKVSNDVINAILDIGKSMIQEPVILLENVEIVLEELKTNYKLIVVTKGDLLDQERKLKKSGLEKYFHHIEIMSDKNESNYKQLLKHLDIEPSEFLMIGNSAKSDVLPVLKIGGWGVYVPFHSTWQFEQINLEELTGFKKYDCINDIKELITLLK